VIIIILAAIGLSPFITGMVLKHNLKTYINVINSNGMIELALVNYQRGYLHSTANLTLKPGQVLQNDPRIKEMAASDNGALLVKLQISHGPLIVNQIEKRISLANGSVTGYVSLPLQLESFIFGKK